MTTRAYVPNVDGEGSIGTTDKKWGAMYVASPDSTASDNRVASTAWVQSIVADALKSAKAEIYKQAKLDAHPVGSYYWSNDSTNPATLFGGTWEALPPGYTLIAQGSGSDDFGSYTYTAGQKYGERKHQLTTDELPENMGKIYSVLLWDGRTEGIVKEISRVKDRTAPTGSNFGGTELNFSGGGKAQNNLPPVVASYVWCRTA